MFGLFGESKKRNSSNSNSNSNSSNNTSTGLQAFHEPMLHFYHGEMQPEREMSLQEYLEGTGSRDDYFSYDDDNAVLEHASRILRRRSEQQPVVFENYRQINSWFGFLIAPFRQEHFVVAFLHDDFSLISCETLFMGSYTFVNVDRRLIARRAIELGSNLVIFAHNHPSGCAQPSDCDLSLTANCMAYLSAIGIRLVDHVIVGHEVYSMYIHGHLGD